jgi:tetratricopeptide (TPR) repeat protein
MDARGSAVLAESTYRKALELDSDNTVTLQNLAQNLIGQGKSSEAISIMEQVLARVDTPAAHKRYGDALALARQYDQANQQYDLALKIDPKYLPALNEKGFMLIKRYVDGLNLDDTLRVKAIEFWKSSLKLNPEQPRISQAIAKWEKPGLFGG